MCYMSRWSPIDEVKSSDQMWTYISSPLSTGVEKTKVRTRAPHVRKVFDASQFSIIVTIQNNHTAAANSVSLNEDLYLIRIRSIWYQFWCWKSTWPRQYSCRSWDGSFRLWFLYFWHRMTHSTVCNSMMNNPSKIFVDPWSFYPEHLSGEDL